MIKWTTQFSRALCPPSHTLDVEACQLSTLSYSHSFFPPAPVCLPNLSPAAKSEPHPTFTTISTSLPGCAEDILKFQNSILCAPIPQSNSNSELISMSENTGSPSNTVTLFGTSRRSCVSHSAPYFNSCKPCTSSGLHGIIWTLADTSVTGQLP